MSMIVVSRGKQYCCTLLKNIPSNHLNLSYLIGGSQEVTVTFAPDHVSDHFSDGVHIELFGEVQNSVIVIYYYSEFATSQWPTFMFALHSCQQSLCHFILNAHCVTSFLMLIVSLHSS